MQTSKIVTDNHENDMFLGIDLWWVLQTVHIMQV